MNEVIKMTEWSLQDYADEINKRYNRLLRAEEVVENEIFGIAGLLNEVKAKLSHGEFMQWVENNCRFSQRHAQRLMRIERRKDEFIIPPTSIRSAIAYLDHQDEMRHACRISSSQLRELLPPPESPRGKLYKRLADLYEYLIRIEEEGDSKFMVVEDEKEVLAEIIIRTVEKLRLTQDRINPTRSHIREVKS